MTSNSQLSSEFRAFQNRCRFDIFIQRRLQDAHDEATVKLAGDYGFKISVEDLRAQRKLGKRMQSTPLNNLAKYGDQLRWLFKKSFNKL